MAESPDSQGKVFISYSHRDKEYLDRLQEHLKPHERAGTIPLWVDTIEAWRRMGGLKFKRALSIRSGCDFAGERQASLHPTS